MHIICITAYGYVRLGRAVDNRKPRLGAPDGDIRLDSARELLPLAQAVFDQAKKQADTIGRTERRFGSPAIMHLARLLDDLWMAADNFVSDIGSPD